MNRIFLFSLVVLCGTVYSQTNELLIDAFGKYENGSYNAAIVAFDKLLTDYKTTKDNKIKLYRGISKLKAGDYSSAITDLKSINENNPQSDLWLAYAYAQMKDEKNTLFYLSRYLKNSPDLFVDKLNKDTSFRFLHNSNEWMDLWQNDETEISRKVIRDAEYSMSKKDFVQAHQIIEREITKDGFNAQIVEFNSEIYDKEGNTELALNEINKVLVTEPENTVWLKKKSDYLVRLAKFTDAEEILNHVLLLCPEDFNSRLNRAEVELNDQHLQSAKKDILLYNKYISSDDAIYLTGRIYYAMGEYLDALKTFNDLMKVKYPDVRYFRARGLTYYQTHTYNLAISDLSMSLDLEPENAEANLYLGLAEYYNNKLSSACYYLQRAKQFGDLKAETYLLKYCNK